MSSSAILDLERGSIVLDIGQSNIRLGFSDAVKAKPDHVLKTSSIKTICSLSSCAAPYQASNLYDSTELQCFHCNIPCDAYEQLINNSLKTNIAEHPVMLVESPITNDSCRSKKLEIFVEGLGVPAFSLSNEARLSLYSYGRHTGLLVYSGYSESYCCAVHEGIIPPYAILPMHHNSGHSLAEMIKTSVMKVANGVKSHSEATLAEAILYMEACGKVNSQPQEAPSNGSEVGEYLFGNSGTVFIIQ